MYIYFPMCTINIRLTCPSLIYQYRQFSFLVFFLICHFLSLTCIVYIFLLLVFFPFCFVASLCIFLCMFLYTYVITNGFKRMQIYIIHMQLLFSIDLEYELLHVYVRYYQGMHIQRGSIYTILVHCRSIWVICV